MKEKEPRFKKKKEAVVCFNKETKLWRQKIKRERESSDSFKAFQDKTIEIMFVTNFVSLHYHCNLSTSGLWAYLVGESNRSILYLSCSAILYTE